MRYTPSKIKKNSSVYILLSKLSLQMTKTKDKCFFVLAYKDLEQVASVLKQPEKVVIQSGLLVALYWSNCILHIRLPYQPDALYRLLKLLDIQPESITIADSTIKQLPKQFLVVLYKLLNKASDLPLTKKLAQKLLEV